MKIQWHALTALPFLVVGQPLAAAFTLLPDAPWVVQEWRYRRARRTRPYLTWHEWVQGEPSPLSPTALVAYRLTHSPLVAILAALFATYFLPLDTVRWALAGWLVHIALDLFTHDGALRVRPLYPLSQWAWPWVHSAYAIGQERGRAVEVVLLSGGWESVACLALATAHAARTGGAVRCVHFQYGQPYAEQELAASDRVAAHFRVTRAVRFVDCPLGAGGVFERRNETFIRTAVAMHRLRNGPLRVWFGGRAPLRAFDRHKDSNAQWVAEMEEAIGVRIRMPLWMHPKWLVKARARARGVTDAMVFSSEGWKYEK